MSFNGGDSGVRADPNDPTAGAVASQYVTPDQLIDTWGLVLVEGRAFLPDEFVEIDQEKSREFPQAVIVTRMTASKLWPGAASVLGKSVYFGYGATARSSRVVGVVERLQSHHAQTGDNGESSLISPVRLTGGERTIYTIRAEPGQVERVIKEAEEALHKAAPGTLILKSQTVGADRAARYRADQALSWMLVSVSVLLLLITASGIVGLASLWVTQRRKQIGMRRALGARRIDIMRYFLTENLLITSCAVVAGALLSIGLNQLLVSKLEMTKLPFGYLLAGAGIFYVLGVAAVYGPAWRAASISPATATRSV